MNLTVRSFEAKAYRSLKAIRYPMSDLDVFVGANGAGKTNLYRALELLRSAAANSLALDLSREGGLMNAMWAGPRSRTGEARIRLGVALSTSPESRSADGRSARDRFAYEVEIGYPPPVAAAFASEPQIKTEIISHIGGSRTVRLVERQGRAVMARDGGGRPVSVDMDLLDSETVLGRLEDPSRYPELDQIRRTLLQWRFYHGLRTDAASPLRRPCPAVATPTLASDGSDLAAVFATLVHIRKDTSDLDAIIDRAFPGASLITPRPDRFASFGMTFKDFPKRVFDAEELSDGTLRFLALAGALLSYRLPPFVALNEPEASLHPDLMSPLAELIVKASERTQVWLVTHSTLLAEKIQAAGRAQVRLVRKVDGATEIEGLRPWGEFAEEDEDED